MIRILNLLLAASVALVLASCANVDTQVPPPLETTTPTQADGIIPPDSSGDTQQAMPTSDTPNPEPFPGKIGLVTNSSSDGIFQGTFHGYGGENVERKYSEKRYSEEKIVFRSWPSDPFLDKELFMLSLTKFEEDQNIKTIITGPARQYVSETISDLRKIRNDIFYICIDPEDNPVDIVQQADVILQIDLTSMWQIAIQQTQKMGAKTFVHYSSSQYMSYPLRSFIRDIIKQECEKHNIKFVNATIPDPPKGSFIDEYEFFLKDVPNMIAQYGKDTVFFTTGFDLRPLIKTVVDVDAMYILPSDQSLYGEFSEVLDVSLIYSDPARWNLRISVDDLRIEIKEALAEKNMLGRVSSLPVDPGMMLVEVSAEYAIKRLNGEVQQEGIDVEVLKQMMEDYAGVEVYLTPYTDDETGETYDNYLLVSMDYITF